jgi:sRNA-binding carbon storage regulator CsrA
MLVLTLKNDEWVTITLENGERIEILLTKSNSNKPSRKCLRIDSPKNVRIHRGLFRGSNNIERNNYTGRVLSDDPPEKEPQGTD